MLTDYKILINDDKLILNYFSILLLRFHIYVYFYISHFQLELFLPHINSFLCTILYTHPHLRTLLSTSRPTHCPLCVFHTSYYYLSPSFFFFISQLISPLLYISLYYVVELTPFNFTVSLKVIFPSISVPASLPITLCVFFDLIT